MVQCLDDICQDAWCSTNVLFVWMRWWEILHSLLVEMWTPMEPDFPTVEHVSMHRRARTTCCQQSVKDSDVDSGGRICHLPKVQVPGSQSGNPVVHKRWPSARFSSCGGKCSQLPICPRLEQTSQLNENILPSSRSFSFVSFKSVLGDYGWAPQKGF